ncbi:MAG: nucleoside recognition family protein [Rhodocyclaceae bacterium]|nr:nucleoside recognition family protein [Rhodocyclaceae bacterium]
MLIEVILEAGRAAVEFALFVMLPIMVVMLCIMRLAEARGWLDWLVDRLAPVLQPFGLSGLGVLAALQINLVSFAAPVATLSIMDQRGVSDRHIAATLAMVFAMAQANASFPMFALGLHAAPTLLISVLGGLVAAAVTYYLCGRHLSAAEGEVSAVLAHPSADSAKGVLDVINRAGAEAFKIATGAIPMLVLSLVAVAGLKRVGALGLLTEWLTPLLVAVSIDPVIILPTLTKFLAGGTAMLGVVDDMYRNGQIDADTINAYAGLLISPFDVPGVAVLISAGRRVGAVWKPAAVGACAGIAARIVGHALFG